jgi:hypothetical protein
MGYATALFIILLSTFAAAAEPDYSKYPVASPSIYYLPVVDLDEKPSCQPGDSLHTVRNPNKKPLQKDEKIIIMCRSMIWHCAMQGSCALIIDKKRTMMHYHTRIEVGKVNGKIKYEPLFVLRDIGKCPYSRGYNDVCADPFFSVAADPVHYPQGTVIFVPILRGILLPDGDIHDGYLIVRDKGEKIKDIHRFDFFTGFLNDKSNVNPFVSLKINDQSTKLRYTVVRDQQIKSTIYKRRNYPGLPTE